MQPFLRPWCLHCLCGCVSHLVHLLPSCENSTSRLHDSEALCKRTNYVTGVFNPFTCPSTIGVVYKLSKAELSVFGWQARQRAREVRKGANNLLWLSHTALHVDSTIADNVHLHYFDIVKSSGCQASCIWIVNTFVRVLNGAWPRRGSYQTRAARIVRSSTILFLMPPIWSERQW